MENRLNVSRGLFVTGTDTNCGKTTVTLALMHLLKAKGYQIIGMKPVACGGEFMNRACHNDDALRIQAASSVLMPYELINPYVFSTPIAPHIAALQDARTIYPDVIVNCYRSLLENANVVIVEGIGGWLVPLDTNFYVADLPKLLNIPVLLVVGLRLGCINHTLLTVRDCLGRGYNLVGWIANLLDPIMLSQKETILALSDFIAAPCLGYVPHIVNNSDVVEITKTLDELEIIKLVNQ